MDQPRWKSLLDIDRLVEAWQSPDTAAPQRMTLLRHVADLAAALDPADREGGENAIPVVVKGPEKKPQAMPMTWVGQKNDSRDGREAGSAEIPPRPDTGARDVTADEIRGLLKSDGRNRQWDNATLRAWAELARQDPEKAKAMLDEVRDAPVRTPDGGVSIPLPPRDGRAKGVKPEAIAEIRESAMTGKDWQGEARGAATAKILPEGRLAAEVHAVTPRQGPILPPGSVRVSDEDMSPDDMLSTLHKIAPHIDEYTDRERKAATSMAYRLERLKERDREAFAKLPGELRNFLGDYKRQMDVERTPILPEKLKDKTTKLTAAKWEGMTDRSAEHALKSAVLSQAFAAPAGRSAESLAEFVSGLNDLFLRHNDMVAEHIEKLSQWGKDRKNIPEPYRTNEVLKAVDALDRIRRGP
jgi:hypothetical protein